MIVARIHAKCGRAGFQYRGACYHLQAAVERFGQVEPDAALVQCYTCGCSILVAEAMPVHGTYFNHRDFDACRMARAGVRRSLGVL